MIYPCGEYQCQNSISCIYIIKPVVMAQIPGNGEPPGGHAIREMQRQKQEINNCYFSQCNRQHNGKT
ncbi:hypothetical protein AMK92_25085 [Escherichia coli]|nr:hypothetical protein AMK92_25085 [Escherichia coli]